MVKKSRLLTGRTGKGRLVLNLMLVGIVMLVGYYFYVSLTGGNNGTGFWFTEDDVSVSLIDTRGTIFDRNFKELAVTLDRVSIYASVRDADPEEAADKLSPILGVSPDSLKIMLESELYRVWLAKNISREEEEAVSALDLDGIHLHKERVRYYPEKETAAHVLGFVGKSMGLAGVEYSYNSLLNSSGILGQDAELMQKKDPAKLADIKQYLVLTIDLKIQRILEKFVLDQGAKSNGGKYAALLMECSTGRVIGAANYPSYDPNHFRDYGHEELRNILAETVQVPYKIRRLLWDASLLQSRFESRKEILPWSIHSNNRGLGSQLRLWDRLGLNDPLEVDFVTNIKDSSEKQFVRIDKGNIFDSVAETATPLHIVTAFNNLIVGGRKVVPRTIDRVAGMDGNVFVLPAEAVEETVDLVVAGEVLNLLDGQMTEGPISSGILQTDSISHMESGNVYQFSKNTMLFSVIPRKNPRFLLFVFEKSPVVSPPPAKTKSGFVLAEAVQRIILPMVALQEVMSNLSDMMSVEEKIKMNFELHQKGTDDSVVANGIEQNTTYQTMPDLQGLSLRKSLRLLRDLKLEIQISGTGVVVEQKPRAGEQVKQGELCRLVLKPH
jgi:cell division protein FtsI (penicillin-binding protein 3)